MRTCIPASGNDDGRCTTEISSDESDIDMQEAIHASVTGSSDWREDLRRLQETVDCNTTPPANLINVVRTDILACFSRALMRKNFRPLQKLDIRFVDSAGMSEMAIDQGGPAREFFMLLLREITSDVVFEGPDMRKQLSLSTNALENNRYFVAGAGIALSLLHGGPAPSNFSELLYHMIVSDSLPSLSIEDVTNINIRTCLKKILEADSIAKAADAVDEASDVLEVIGSLIPIRTLLDRDALVQSSLRYFLCHRLHTCLLQFCQGLDIGGVLTCIRRNSTAWKTVFVHPDCPLLTARQLIEMFTPQLSPEGSNKHSAETKVLAFWGDWLIDVAENERPVSLQQVLVFATGAEKEPPLGFPVQPTIAFNHDELRRGEVKYPTANTCGLNLTLPVVSSFDEFIHAMEDGIIQAPQFGFQ